MVRSLSKAGGRIYDGSLDPVRRGSPFVRPADASKQHGTGLVVQVDRFGLKLVPDPFLDADSMAVAFIPQYGPAAVCIRIPSFSGSVNCCDHLHCKWCRHIRGRGDPYEQIRSIEIDIDIVLA